MQGQRSNVNLKGGWLGDGGSRKVSVGAEHDCCCTDEDGNEGDEGCCAGYR